MTNKAGAYLDRAMSEADIAAFVAHLKNCGECSKELARLQRLSGFLGAARMNEMKRPRIAATWEARVDRQRLVRFAEILMGAAATILLVCGVWLMKMQPQPASTASNAVNWERMAISQQLDMPRETEIEDPLVQVLLRDNP